MNSDPRTRADAASSTWPRAYRALILEPNGSLVSARALVASNDEEAINQAESMVDGHAVELWDGLRFIEHFDAVTPT